MALATALPPVRSPWQTGEERLLLLGPCPQGQDWTRPFGAWCWHSSSAVIYNQGNKQPCTLGRGAQSLHGCLPQMNGHNPLNNGRLLCLCLSFWQGSSFQVLLISALLATLRVSIAGRPSQPVLRVQHKPRQQGQLQAPPDPQPLCLALPAGLVPA